MFVPVALLLSCVLCFVEPAAWRSTGSDVDELAVKVNVTRQEIILSLQKNGILLTKANINIQSTLSLQQAELALKVESLYELLGSGAESTECLDKAKTQVKELEAKVVNGSLLEECRQAEAFTLAGSQQEELRTLLAQVSQSIGICKKQNPGDSEGLTKCVDAILTEASAKRTASDAAVEEILTKATLAAQDCVKGTATPLLEEASQIESQIKQCP